jgi:hypothetical protein
MPRSPNAMRVPLYCSLRFASMALPCALCHSVQQHRADCYISPVLFDGLILRWCPLIAWMQGRRRDADRLQVEPGVHGTWPAIAPQGLHEATPCPSSLLPYQHPCCPTRRDGCHGVGDPALCGARHRARLKGIVSRASGGESAPGCVGRMHPPLSRDTTHHDVMDGLFASRRRWPGIMVILSTR